MQSDNPQELLALLAVINSAPFKKLVEVQLARTELAQSFEVGLIQQTPVPQLTVHDQQQLCELAHRAWSLKRTLNTAELTSHAFILPALLQTKGTTLTKRAAIWMGRIEKTEATLAAIQAEIDDLCFDLYGFSDADRSAALGGDTGSGDTEEAESDEEEDTESETTVADAPHLIAALTDWLAGVAFGRFDLRLATGEREPPPEPEPFDPLPACSPGMLTGEHGLPVEEPPSGYLIDFPDDGILVDDPGPDEAAPAERDIVRRIQQVLQLIWTDRWEAIEREACEILGVRTLRDYFRKPAGFFADHLRRYSKSRRRAPIYWPLSTDSGTYTLWLYYPRLTDQTLYTCANDHIDPKLREIEADIQRLRGAGQPDRKTQKLLDDLVELQRELKAMREELLRVAHLPYKPDQNDGVLITAAPLWRLFRYKSWQKDLKKCWEELEVGKYDWAHLAYAIWPERVQEVCRRDKSVAIAHGLEELFNGQD